METANYILSILRSRQMIMWSWGFAHPMALPNDEGLVFIVDGYKHKGLVKVVYNEGKDLFVVILIGSHHHELLRIDDVYFDTLIDVIDDAVERTSDYEIRVKKDFNLN